MLSWLGLIFVVPAAVFVWIPLIATLNGQYDGTQAISAVTGVVISLPGLILIAIDIIKRGWRGAPVGVVGVSLLLWTFPGMLLGGGICEVTKLCGYSERSTVALQQGFDEASPTMPRPISVESAQWEGPPNNPALKAAWLVGSEQARGLYLIRVKLSSGGRIDPHSHPDARVTTVLSGTLYVGFGERFDEGALVAISAGDAYVAPAGVRHFLSARDGDVVYQESGSGPTGMRPSR